MIIEYYGYTYIFGKEFWNPLDPPNFTMAGIHDFAQQLTEANRQDRFTTSGPALISELLRGEENPHHLYGLKMA